MPQPRLASRSLEERHERARSLIEAHAQGHVLEAWHTLSGEQQEQLLGEIERVDWALLQTLSDRLIRDAVHSVDLPDAPWEPAQPNAGPEGPAREAGLEVLRDTTTSSFGVIIVAGGTGSGLRFPHPKGLFPATPVRKTSLYEAMVEKVKAAARAHGHSSMFPTIVMLSDETEPETRAFFEQRRYFGERDRLLMVRQPVLPVLDRRPDRLGLAVMAAPGRIALGGTGHGDALDYTLSHDATALEWLEERGVAYLQFLNIDNLLNPIADPVFVGEHLRSEPEAVPGAAHISIILIPKTGASRLGNVIQYRDGGQLRYRSIDYGLYPEVDARCPLGHASLQILTLRSLPQSAPIPYLAVEKEVRVNGEWIPVWKLERSSNNKERYGALLERRSEAVFAPIKTRDELGGTDTPSAAARRLSDHWVERLRDAFSTAGIGMEIPPTARVELPWDADYMDPARLGGLLRDMRFPHALEPDTGYWVLPDFRGFRTTSLGEAPIASSSGSVRPGGHGRRRDDHDPDWARKRAIIAAFNNHFERDPDVLARAPGRNTAIGDHMDYPALPQDGSAHSVTIAWGSQQNVLVAARRREDRAIKLLAVNPNESFTFSLDDLEGLSQEAAHGNLPDVYGQPLHPWAMSILALLYSAQHGRQGVRTGLPLHGAEFAFEGSIPIGAGQSSSAAFLVAITLACNELFGWEIPRDNLYTLADLARSGEHEDYSPFIKKGRSGYLDQITSLAAQPGQAVVIDHGCYDRVDRVDLGAIENAGYVGLIVLSGLSRELGETEYRTRVDELSRLPRALNQALCHRRTEWQPKAHVHQFTAEEWREVADDLDAQDPTLARRARYVFEEKERTSRFLAALAAGDAPALLELVNQSGEAMSMSGAYQISGHNVVPRDDRRIAALDLLREIVLRHAGTPAAARMVGGGGAGPLYVIVPKAVLENPSFAREVVTEWRERTGLTARLVLDPPAAGAAIVWKRERGTVIRAEGSRRIERYADVEGNPVYRLIDDESGTAVEVIPSRGTVRSMKATIRGVPKEILYNPEANPAENGAAPYLGPWINRIKDGRAVFRGHRVNLMRVRGVRDDGSGHALHGLMDQGWHVDEERSRIDADGIALVSWIDSADYTDDRDVQKLFGPARTVLVHRLKGSRVHIESTVTHLGSPESEHAIPVLAAVHPWFLLSPRKHQHAELMLPARRRRVTWGGMIHRLRQIPIPLVPGLPIVPRSRHDFRSSRALGTEPYDDSYTDLVPSLGASHPVVELRDWFRDVLIHVGVVTGYDEFTLYRPESGANTVCLEPQISSVNALGEDAPPDAHVPTIRGGESFITRMYIDAVALSTSGITCPFAAPPTGRPSAPTAAHFPRLISSGFELGPLAEPQKTASHKDAIRVFFAGQWHIYGTGHQMKDLNNPPPGHRPHRGSILFHLVAPEQSGPYTEANPPLLLGQFPKGVYEAPSVVADGNTLHLYAQTTYYRLGGSIEHFVSTDGHHFTWVGTALSSTPGGQQAGVYDADVMALPSERGSQRIVMVYSGFSREGGRDDRPDPQLFIAESMHGWDGPFTNGRLILTDVDVPWHNSHSAANPYYEWGLEGAQLLPLPNGQLLLLSVAFERRPGLDYMAAQRLLFALYDKEMKLIDVSDPILPLAPGWDEYGHGSMMIDVNEPDHLRMLYQARPANADKAFRDSNTWRLFEALFDISHLR
jgi:galactokinase/galactose mutarotase-like enzyme